MQELATVQQGPDTEFFHNLKAAMLQITFSNCKELVIQKIIFKLNQRI
jgi:hypothetical protein